MATDKRLDQVSQLTDFDYALLVKGDQVGKMTKQQVAEAIGNLLYGATTKETLASVVAGIIGYDKSHDVVVLPQLKSKAVLIFTFTTNSSFIESSVFFRISAFQGSTFGFIAINKSNTQFSAKVKMVTATNNNTFYYKNVNNVIYVYAAGNFDSLYDGSDIELWCNGKKSGVNFAVTHTTENVGTLEATEITPTYI